MSSNSSNSNATHYQVMNEAVTMALVDAIANLDTTMFLSHAEYDLAVAIRQAVEANEHLTNLTDMEYVQYALTVVSAQETMDSILERIYMMQAFRREYNIQDTAADGIQLFNDLTLQHPGWILTIDYVASTQNYIAIRDLAAFYPSRPKTPVELRIMMGGMYYIFECMNPNFTAIRNGMSSMNECMDVTMENFSYEAMEKLLHELIRPYPKNQRGTFFLNSPEMINVFFSMYKRFLTEKITKTFQMGHQVEGMEGRRIDELYKIPTPEIAREKVVLRVYDFLQLRYLNRATFSLANCVKY
jgi:CRAL/TRIO domain